MRERIAIPFEDEVRADRWHDGDGFDSEKTSDQPGDEPGFFDGKDAGEPDNLDSLGWYRRSLGEVPKLTAEQETELAKQIEAGKFAGQLLETCDRKKSSQEREERIELLRALYEANQLPVTVYDELYHPVRENGTETFEAMLQRLVGTVDQLYKRRDLEKVARIGTEARTQLIHTCLPLVVHIVRRDYWGDLPLSQMDLVSCGNIGVMRAVDAFDYARGARLGATVAPLWIHKEIKAGILEAKRQRHLRATTAEQERADKVDQARKELEDSDDPSEIPTVAALAERTGIKEDWVWDTLDSSTLPASVEELAISEEDGTIYEKAKAPGVDDQVILRVMPEVALPELAAADQLARDVELLLSTLSRGERSVVRKAFGFEGEFNSLIEIAQELGVTKNTVDTQYRRGIKKLRARPEFLARLAQRLNIILTLENATASPDDNAV